MTWADVQAIASGGLAILIVGGGMTVLGFLVLDAWERKRQ